jgi:putative two-component system response regulator
MSTDPVIRDLSEALHRSPAASSPGMSALLERAISRSTELEKSSGETSVRFFRHLGRDLPRLRGSAHSKARLECLFRACAFLWQYGEFRDAISIANHAIGLAESTENLAELRRHHLALGVLHADAGDAGLAIQSYLSSLGFAAQLSDGFGECAAWNNLAALFIDCGLYGEAIACATQCLRTANKCGIRGPEVYSHAHNNIVLARHRLGDHAGALLTARTLVSCAREPKTALEASRRIILERNMILVLLAMGEVEEANLHVNEARRIVARFPAPRQELLVRTVMGLCDVVTGDSSRGIVVLEEAVETAYRTIPSVIPDALSALAKAHEEVGNCEGALEVTRRLISHLEAIHVGAIVAQLSSAEMSMELSASVQWPNMAELRRSEAELRSKVLQREVVRTRQDMLERMAVAADIREDISGEHGYRVGRLSALLAKEIGWDRDACNAIDIAARLHDIGKIGIPERILFDERTLKEAEKHFIASHTLVGAEILSKSEIPQIRIAEEIARCHHEWWDGTGYPKGLREKSIPKSARIVALADVFDAMTHGRPYAKAVSVESALDQIAALRGRQFEPELTDHFLALVRRLAATNEDLDAYLGKAGRNSPFLKARARIKEMLAQGRDSMANSSPPPPPGTPLN